MARAGWSASPGGCTGSPRSLPPGLERHGIRRANRHFFDTLTLEVGGSQTAIIESAREARINLRVLGRGKLGVSLDETCSEATVEQLLAIFLGADHGLSVAELDAGEPEAGIPAGLERRSAFLTHRCSTSITAKPRCCATSSSWRTKTWRSTRR